MGLDDALGRAKIDRADREARAKTQEAEESDRLRSVTARLEAFAAEVVAHCQSQGRRQTAGFCSFASQYDETNRSSQYAFTLTNRAWEIDRFLLDSDGRFYVNARSLVFVNGYPIDGPKVNDAVARAKSEFGITRVVTSANEIGPTGKVMDYVSEWDTGATVFLRGDSLQRTNGLGPFEDEIATALLL